MKIMTFEEREKLRKYARLMRELALEIDELSYIDEETPLIEFAEKYNKMMELAKKLDKMTKEF